LREVELRKALVELYGRIWELTWRAQLLLIVLSISVAVLSAVPLQFQKSIVNGLEETMQQDRLILLCAGYLAVMALTSVLRFAMNYRSQTLGENVIRRIRISIYEDRLRYSQSEGRDTRGQLVTMIANEAEELGRFAGQAIASPFLQIGTLISVIGFIAYTQPYLGIFLLLVIVPQAAIVLSLQKSINEKVAVRVRVLRRSTSAITAEVLEKTQQAVLDDFDEIYEVRRRIFKLKVSMKLALNIIFGMGTVGILLLGGLLFIDGRTDIGSIVAALSAIARINEPWRTLIAFYRELSAVLVRYQLLMDA
jgi:ABC-type multidrug transport system fused ATPase/permease subunit